MNNSEGDLAISDAFAGVIDHFINEVCKPGELSNEVPDVVVVTNLSVMVVLVCIVTTGSLV